MHVFAPKPNAAPVPAKRAAAPAPRPRALPITLGGADDAFEHEASRVAERVARTPDPHPGHDCACGGTCDACRRRAQTAPRLQTLRAAPDAAAGARGGGQAPAIVHEVLGSSGQPLDPATRGWMESSLGHDFSGVRVHADARAAESARAVHALAYTVRNDVVFGPGRYAPGTQEGRRLLAHELVHTVQQGQGAPLLQRAGAGGCAAVAETVDEQRDELAYAGRMAHAQIQGRYSSLLSAEVPIPRATKDQRSLSCPPPRTPNGRADLWSYGGGLSPVEVGEIKSINGRQYAKPDVDHYRLRLEEMAGRFGTGTPCPGPADAVDQAFDQSWLNGSLAAGRKPSFDALSSVIPESPPARLGPFWGDPLRKNLSCQREQDGAVVYWCTPRRLTREQEEAERLRLGIPAGEWGRRTAPQAGTRAPQNVIILPDFREIERQLPVQVPAARHYILVVPDRLYTTITGLRRIQQTVRYMQIDPRANPVLQYRLLTWGTLAASLAVGTMAMITAVVIATLPVSAPAVAAGGAAAGGGAAGGGTMGVLVPLFTTQAARETAKAAAVLIVSATLAGGGSEAQAADNVREAMTDPEVVGMLDVTDDPHALSGGDAPGSRVTVNGRPYRVVGSFDTFGAPPATP